MGDTIYGGNIYDNEERLSLTFLQEAYENGIKEARRIFFKMATQLCIIRRFGQSSIRKCNRGRRTYLRLNSP